MNRGAAHDRTEVRESRRAFLGRTAGGIGVAALAALLNPVESLRAAAEPPASRGVINPLHFVPKAKRVIWLYQAGGPTHLETFDYKPKLAEMDGKPMPESFTKGQPIAQLQGAELKCFAPQYGFRKFGQSGQEICELFPHIGAVADEICILRAMRTDAINHDPAHTFMNTGSFISGRPAMGSWVIYGLGSECENLPGFVVLMSTGRGGQSQPISSRQWHSGFLPSRHQGVKFQSFGEAVYYLSNPPGITPEMRGDYEAHFAECEHCRRKQRLHRTIDFTLIGLATVSAFVFLLAFAVIRYLRPQHAFILEVGSLVGFSLSALIWLIVAVATPAPMAVVDVARLGARILAHRLVPIVGIAMFVALLISTIYALLAVMPRFTPRNMANKNMLNFSNRRKPLQGVFPLCYSS